MIFTALGSPHKNIIVVSDDIRLVQKIASKWTKSVYRIPVRQWVTAECDSTKWYLDDAELLLDTAQIERLLEAAPLLAYGEAGWIAKDLVFTETFNVDCDWVPPSEQGDWPNEYKVRPSVLYAKSI